MMFKKKLNKFIVGFLVLFFGLAITIKKSEQFKIKAKQETTKQKKQLKDLF